MATALTVLWCAQPLALVLHAQVHTHRYCLEHNAFEEGLRPGEAPAASPASLSVLGSDEAPSSTPAHSGGHDECSVAAATSPGVLCPGGRGLPSPALSALGPPSWGALQAFLPLRLLDLAPKASPPAALTSSVG